MAALKRQPTDPANLPAPAAPFGSPIPIARPRLPTRAAITPYLDRIDQAGWYANYGPLVLEFERRIGERLGGRASIVTVANGTVALALALRAAGARPGALCLMPAWTFVATPHAALQAGLTPYFVDVDPATWMLDPAAMDAAIGGAPGDVGAIMPVAAFGRMPDLDAWRAVADATGVPVIVDGAAGFDALDRAPVPVTVSLHATKTVAAGEGGFVASDNPAFLDTFRALTAFGFCGDRIARLPATNAKLSEYGAAVGLASLDAWPAGRTRFALTAQRLRAALTLTPQIAFQPGWGARWVSSVCVVGVPQAAAASMARTMAAMGVDTRAWWGDGCHRHPAFAACPRAPLPVTDRLAAGTLGLPYFVDLEEDGSARIVEALHAALKVEHG